ncbi:hypothetical protein AgCh_039371 [Apium graveolens]
MSEVDEDRDGYWKIMNKYVGADVTSLVTLPVLIFEPMSMLQKMAEIMEYSYLLDLADDSCWFISVYYAMQRTWKPFNPILGETYEMTNHSGVTFIAEQKIEMLSNGLVQLENIVRLLLDLEPELDPVWHYLNIQDGISVLSFVARAKSCSINPSVKNLLSSYGTRGYRSFTKEWENAEEQGRSSNDILHAIVGTKSNSLYKQ